MNSASLGLPRVSVTHYGRYQRGPKGPKNCCCGPVQKFAPGLGPALLCSSELFAQTCKEGHEQRHPAEYVGPGEAPVAEALSQEVDGDAGVDGHREQDEEGWCDKRRGGLHITAAEIPLEGPPELLTSTDTLTADTHLKQRT